MNDGLLKNILMNKNESSNEDELNDALNNISPEELSMLAKVIIIDKLNFKMNFGEIVKQKFFQIVICRSREFN